jgi:hypothetical protein
MFFENRFRSGHVDILGFRKRLVGLWCLMPLWTIFQLIYLRYNMHGLKQQNAFGWTDITCTCLIYLFLFLFECHFTSFWRGYIGIDLSVCLSVRLSGPTSTSFVRFPPNFVEVKIMMCELCSIKDFIVHWVLPMYKVSWTSD